MKNNNIKILFITLFSMLIGIIIMPLRGVMLYDNIPGVNLCSLLGFVLYFSFTLLCLNKYSHFLKSKVIFISILFGAAILQLPIRIIDFEGTLISLPDFVLHLSGILFGYFSYKQSVTIRSAFFLVGFGFCVFMYFRGHELWRNKLSFGTFTGKVESIQKYNLVFQTNAGDTLSLSDFKGKYLLLDCWYTYCGVCYRKMPEMQELYDEYGQNPEINMYAMHSFIKEKRENNSLENYVTGSEILKKEGFNYPCLSIDIKDTVLKDLGVNGYPTVLIFDKQSSLIFRGNIENAKKLIENRLKTDKK